VAGKDLPAALAGARARLVGALSGLSMNGLILLGAGLSLAAHVGTIGAAAADAPEALQPRPAPVVAHAASTALMGVARAGDRLVAVGDHGVVLLSDDDGRQWRQARSVPVRSLLTAVSFADARRGWAVGHWGVVLATEDGGETWQLQRSDTAEDRPLFAVHAFDTERLVTVGLWSLVLSSADGGKTWSPMSLPLPPAAQGATAKKADLNLFGLFTDTRGRLYAAAERGMLLRSEDHGASWTYLPTGFKGSFWTGASPAPGVVVAAGLRGAIYRSVDDGKTWARVDNGSKASITSLVVHGTSLVALGLDGLQLRSVDAGEHFTGSPRADRAALTAGAARKDGALLLFSRSGIVKD
jgi:photosystem II stability/assembly factor-like uncharacterized protein